VCGTLATSADALAHAIKTQRVDQRECHMRAVELFSSQSMSKNYLAKYDEVVSGVQLNSQSPQLQAGFKDLPWSG
jgi:hypothetical protein